MCVCVCVCGGLCLSCRRPVLSPALDEDCRCANIGPWESVGLRQNAGGVVDEIWFECSCWNGKYHIRGIQYTSPCPKDTGVHYTPALMYLREFQCLSPWSLPSSWRVQYHTASLLFFLLNSACRIDNHGLICLPRLLSGSTAKQRENCVSVFCGILSNLKDWGNQCFFHFESGNVAFDNRPVAKWEVSLKVATKISIMGITSCILQSVIGPITAA